MNEKMLNDLMGAKTKPKVERDDRSTTNGHDVYGIRTRAAMKVGKVAREFRRVHSHEGAARINTFRI